MGLLKFTNLFSSGAFLLLFCLASSHSLRSQDVMVKERCKHVPEALQKWVLQCPDIYSAPSPESSIKWSRLIVCNSKEAMMWVVEESKKETRIYGFSLNDGEKPKVKNTNLNADQVLKLKAAFNSLKESDVWSGVSDEVLEVMNNGNDGSFWMLETQAGLAQGVIYMWSPKWLMSHKHDYLFNDLDLKKMGEIINFRSTLNCIIDLGASSLLPSLDY